MSPLCSLLWIAFLSILSWIVLWPMVVRPDWRISLKDLTVPEVVAPVTSFSDDEWRGLI